MTHVWRLFTGNMWPGRNLDSALRSVPYVYVWFFSMVGVVSSWVCCEGERNVAPVFDALGPSFDFWAGQASLDKKLVIVSKNLNFGVTLYWRSGSAFVSEWSPSCGSFQREGTHRKCERSPVRIGHRVFCFCLSSSFGVGHRGFVVASGWRVEREEKMGDPYVRTISTWSYVRNVNLSEKMPAIACMAAVRKFIVLYWIRDSMY